MKKTVIINLFPIEKKLRRYDIPLSRIIDIIVEYIKTRNEELFTIKLEHMAGPLGIFIKQEIKMDLIASSDVYHFYGHVLEIKIQHNKIILFTE